MQQIIVSCLNRKQIWKPCPKEILALPETIWDEPREKGVKAGSNLGYVSCTKSEQSRTFYNKKYGSGSHRVAVVTDQSFMILYPSQAKFTPDDEILEGASPARVVNARDEFIDRQVRDYEVHAERWLEGHREVEENDIVLLAMNLDVGKQYDFDLFGCNFSVIARPKEIQVVSMREYTDTSPN